MVRLTAALILSMGLAACQQDTPRIAVTQNAGDTRVAKVLFGAAPRPTAQSPAALGGYAQGCQAGAVALPETGPTWQAMRLSRNRNWAQPVTVEYIQDLSRFAATLPGWNGIYVGDLSQPRGGPMLTGHASHQTGLDADIWMLPATRLNLSRAEREAISSISMRRANGAYVNTDWTPAARGADPRRSIRPAHGADFCLSRGQGRNVPECDWRPQLAEQGPALVRASLPFPRPAELPRRGRNLRRSGPAASR